MHTSLGGSIGAVVISPYDVEYSPTNHGYAPARMCSSGLVMLFLTWSVGMVILFRLLGVVILAGIGVILIMIPINWRVSNLQTKYAACSCSFICTAKQAAWKNACMEKKDRRIKFIAEVLHLIRLIKV